MAERFRRYWADTIGHPEKISSGQTFTDILNLRCGLDLERSNPIFSHRTLWLMMMLYYQTKFGCTRTSSLEDTTEIVIFWLYKSSMRPWHYTQWTNFSARHSGLWCCITIPGLVTNCSVVQKVSSRQTCWTFAVTLTLNTVLNFFYRTLKLMMQYFQTKFGYK